MDKSIFGYDPDIGCPFDDSEMEMVESWKGFSVGDTVEFRQDPDYMGTCYNPWIRGIVIAIGVNAKFLDGDPFVAFSLRVEGNLLFKTHRDIHHVV